VRGSLVALGVTVVVAAAAVIVSLNLGQAVAGTPVAGDRPVESTAPPPEPACAGEDELVASGSSLATEAISHLTAAYEAACPGRSVNYSPSGQGAGIQDFISGTTGMAVTDRPLDAGELAQAGQRCEVQQLPFVVQPVRIVYHLTGAPDITLDASVLAKIFSGAITQWNDPAIAALNDGVALPAVLTMVVSRADETGVTAVLQQYLAAAGGWTGGTGTTFTGQFMQTVRDNVEMLEAVANIEGAIGYALPAEYQGLRIGGVRPDLDAMAATISAALPDDGLVFDPAELYRADDGAYPIVILSYAVGCADSPAVSDFVLSSLTAQDGETGFLFPTGEWADRLRDL
jgi:phosphate transport system substrate-binding protein